MFNNNNPYNQNNNPNNINYNPNNHNDNLQPQIEIINNYNISTQNQNIINNQNFYYNNNVSLQGNNEKSGHDYSHIPYSNNIYFPNNNNNNTTIQQPCYPSVPICEIKEILPSTDNNIYLHSKENIEISSPHKIEQDIKIAPLNTISFNIKKGFIRKVYGILFAQVLLTFLITCLSFAQSVRTFFQANNWIIYLAAFVILVVCFAMICYKKTSMNVPVNYILLFSLTVGVAILLLNLCSYYSPEHVLISWSATLVMSLSIIIITHCNKNKFNVVLGLIGIILASLLFFAIVMIVTTIFFKTDVYTIHCIFSTVGALVYGLYLFFHTYCLINGFTEDIIDLYIFYSLTIYSDIIMVFFYIVGSSYN